MPEMSLPPVNQCRADRPDDGAPASPTTVVVSSAENAAEPLASVAALSHPEEVATSGSAALVDRFGAEEHGSLGSRTSRHNCFGVELRALATCAGGAGAAMASGGITVVLTAAGCAGALIPVIECERGD